MNGEGVEVLRMTFEPGGCLLLWLGGTRVLEVCYYISVWRPMLPLNADKMPLLQRGCATVVSIGTSDATVGSVA